MTNCYLQKKKHIVGRHTAHAIELEVQERFGIDRTFVLQFCQPKLEHVTAGSMFIYIYFNIL